MDKNALCPCMYICMSSSPIIFTGHGPVVIFPWNDLGPTNCPLNIPPAMIAYVTPHSNSLTVTVAIPLVIGAVPKNATNRAMHVVMELHTQIIIKCYLNTLYLQGL